mmetsp:Transcript_28908/g.52851  ORF Transcript_28908/g.52851 Transcript_28908/m.52851 type:complete len:434 (+) Transcript_28908:140-1441(+)
MSGKFQPPKWCCVPKDPEKHARSLSWVSSEGGNAPHRPDHHIAGTKAYYTLGRDDAADVKLVGEMASRVHAAILLDAEGRKFLVDLRSTHGTFLNGKRLTPHQPVRWNTGEHASFGSGLKADTVELRGPEVSGSSKRKRDPSSGNESPEMPVAKQKVEDPLAALYEGLPDAENIEPVAPRIETKRPEPLPEVRDPTKIIFLDIDGCLRPVHGRRGFDQGIRTMLVEGVRVPLLGDGEAKAGLIGLDFWPQALRALRHIVQKTEARIVLSSDWRKAPELIEGINGQLQEHRMPQLFDTTPDLDKVTEGVVKALHGSFREKRCKEIRKWLRQHPKVTRFVAIDDIDLSIQGPKDANVCLDPTREFIRCAPMVGLTMDLAKLGVCYLNDLEVTQEFYDSVYSNSSGNTAASEPAPNPFQMGMGGPEATPGLMPGLP